MLNTGSSSIKYELFDAEGVRSLLEGILEEIGEPQARLRQRTREGVAAEDADRAVDAPDHDAALAHVLAELDREHALADRTLVAVGHRVVHGGERFIAPTIVTPEVLAELHEVAPLAPLHDPANIAGIEAATRALPGVPQVAVFDTAFHATLPPHAYRYAIPCEWYERHGIRRFGFHGISHEYVSRAAAKHLGHPPAALNMITLHLGNGASACAIRAGMSVETSMGMTPLEGLVMGTRSGDVDPAIAGVLARFSGMDPQTAEDALNNAGGMLGLCGESDMREVHRLADSGEADARLALDVYCHRLRKYIGAYAAVLGRVDAIVFTAGVGENDAEVRERVCEGLEHLGVRLDHARNLASEQGIRVISADDSRVAVLVVPTDEELEIARQVLACVGGAAAEGACHDE